MLIRIIHSFLNTSINIIMVHSYTWNIMDSFYTIFNDYDYDYEFLLIYQIPTSIDIAANMKFSLLYSIFLSITILNTFKDYQKRLNDFDGISTYL